MHAGGGSNPVLIEWITERVKRVIEQSCTLLIFLDLEVCLVTYFVGCCQNHPTVFIKQLASMQRFLSAVQHTGSNCHMSASMFLRIYAVLLSHCRLAEAIVLHLHFRLMEHLS